MSANSGWARFLPWVIIVTKMSKLLKAAKFLKVAKPMITVVTMSLSAVAYAFWLGPWFAVGLIGMLFIHEWGHIIAMNMRGYKASAPVFIPFLGAVIFAPKMTSRDDEAFIGIGGPLVGGLAAAAFFGLWALMPDKESNAAVIILMISYVGLFLNVFNLLPIRPLDGGRITQAVGSWFKYIGVGALALGTALFQEPVLLFIWILVMPELTALSIRVRGYISAALWVLMTALMVMGYSTQPFWVDVVDIVFAGLIAGTTLWMGLVDEDPVLEDDERPELSSEGKWRWFIYYAALTVLLVGLMVMQVGYLPTPT